MSAVPESNLAYNRLLSDRNYTTHFNKSKPGFRGNPDDFIYMKEKIQNPAAKNGKSAKLQKTGEDTSRGLAKFNITGGHKSAQQKQMPTYVLASVTKMHEKKKMCNSKMKVKKKKLAKFKNNACIFRIMAV